MSLPLLMFKISSMPSPMLPLTASDAGIHILDQDTLANKNKRNFNLNPSPDGIQSFRGWTIRISPGCDKIPDSSKALWISRFKSRAFVDNNMTVIVWAKRKVDIERSC